MQRGRQASNIYLPSLCRWMLSMQCYDLVTCVLRPCTLSQAPMQADA